MTGPGPVPDARESRAGMTNAGVEWVATPPGGVRPRRRGRRRERYTGPPAYPAIPRWGFPLVAWRRPSALPTRQGGDPMTRAESAAAAAIPVLWITAWVALLAGASEVWRYALLVLSRDRALSVAPLLISDALVATAGVLTWLLGLLGAVLVVRWALWARTAATARTGRRSARPDWHVMLGVLVPGLNLLWPGAALAELEHSLLVAEGARNADDRPSPSLSVRFWWACWVAALLVGWLTMFWGLRDGVQASADGVLLHACSDFLVVVLAVSTAQLIKYVARLLSPPDPAEIRREHVAAVRAAQPLGRRARPDSAAR